MSASPAPRVRIGPFTRPLHRRRLLVSALAATALVGLALLALQLGELRIPMREALDAIVGARTGFRAIVITQWRLPRILAAAVFGSAFGVSGAIFQTLTRNPLGTPDVLGFSTGAYTGALVVLVVLGGPWSLVSVGALLGGALAALLVLALSGRSGSVLRLVLIGVGLSAMLSAVNHWLIARAELEVSLSASMFGSGSLNGVAWHEVLPATIAVLVLMVLVLASARHLPALELGEEHARGMGMHVERMRLRLLLLGIALVAMPTAVIGPVAFVALTAPSIARRLCGGGLIASGLVGALLLLGADALAQRVIAPSQLPVGIVTGCVGGLYLVVLLLRGAR